MKITTAIFDLDGTLLNTLGDLTDSVNVAMLRHNLPPATEEEVRKRVGNGVRKLIELSLPPDSSEQLLDACFDDFRTAYEARMSNRTQPYDGILPLLKALKKAGVAVGVLSNKYDLAAKGLIRQYFGDLCQFTQGERPGVPRKPDPTGALNVLRELGGIPSETLYIGDSPTDMQTAKNAGLTAVGVTWGYRTAQELTEAGADALVHTPAELLPLFEQGLLNIDAICGAFTTRGFGFTYLETAAQARDYLCDTCAGKTVTFGGSQTLAQLGLYDALKKSAVVYSHEVTPGRFKQDPDIYICSANGLSETGEVVNIDGRCNRVAGTLYGPKRCIFVCGVNKLCPDLARAIERAKNVAAPLNAQRLTGKAPSLSAVTDEDRKAADRISRAIVIHLGPPTGMQKCEIVLIGEPLGF